MVYKPAYFEVNQHAIDPNKISGGLDFKNVCGWVGKYKGDPKYSGRFCSNPQPANISLNPALEFTLDEDAADNGQMKNQDEWVAYFNARKERMASMPDLYLAGKSGDPSLLTSLNRDFGKRWVITSTRIKYDDENNARIIHHYGSTVVKPVEHKVLIPEYRPYDLEEVLNTKEGLRYLQILFGTNDSAQEIKETLQKLSQCPPDRIFVYSAPLETRTSISRVSGFDRKIDLFRVYGNNSVEISGDSRGVRIK